LADDLRNLNRHASYVLDEVGDATMKTLLLGSTVSAAVLAVATAGGSSQLADVTSQLGMDRLVQTHKIYLSSPIVEKEMVKTITATGTLNATVNIQVGSQLSGLISKVDVTYNERVKRGDVLAEIDDRSFRADCEQKEAALATARSAVEVARLNLDRAIITAADAQFQATILDTRIDKATIEFEMLARDAARKTQLVERAAGSLAEAQTAGSRRDAAAADQKQAQAGRAAQGNIIRGGLKDIERARAELEVARLGIAQAEAALKASRIELERTRIRAPIDGVIVGKSVDAGETLASSLETKTMFILAGDLEKMEIYARVDESDIGMIEVGQPAVFTVDAFPGETFTASVQQIRKQPMVVQNVVTYTVVLATNNPELKLLPGMTALTNIVIRRRPSVLQAPMAALRYSPDGASLPGGSPRLWIQDLHGGLRGVPVSPGEDDGNKIVVDGEGLSAGTQVVIGERVVDRALSIFGLRMRL
jgi:HlyD family secretion protein